MNWMVAIPLLVWLFLWGFLLNYGGELLSEPEPARFRASEGHFVCSDEPSGEVETCIFVRE